MKVVFSPSCLEYSFPGHPESRERVARMRDALKAGGYGFTRADPATEKDVLLAHTREHLERVRTGSFSDPDTPPIDIRFPLAAAGAAIKASEIRGFALTRPPGHHAGRDFLGGFCYFNNIAIAVKKLGKKAAILDLDVHHGNGTQDIFLGDEKVLYVSLHQFPLFPGTGMRSEANCRNFPLPPGTGEKEYLKTLEKALAAIGLHRPELLAVSMGFDTYEHDPLAGQRITEKGFGTIGRMVKALGLPTFIVLEGGYSERTGELCLSFLNGFS